MKMNRTTSRILLHLSLWIIMGFILLTYTPLNWGVNLPAAFWVKHVIHYVILIILFYLNYQFLAPRLLLKKRQTAAFIAMCLGIILATMVINEWINTRLHLVEIKKQILVVYKLHEKFDMMMLFSLLLVFGISTSIIAIKNRQSEILKNKELKEQQISSELSFLKAQIHPHFFFNTLNNIYSLTYTDIEASREALHKLSWMMRYLLYETQNDQTTLKNELRFITDYIELMRIRLNRHTSIELTVPQDYNDCSVSPMLLLPFIENAFKHGVGGSGRHLIKIVIEKKEDKLFLLVQNTAFVQKSCAGIDSGGIGLSNTRRRLSLLYKDRFTLSTILRPDNIYEVKLEIDLA